jgi:hypothetical protein
LLYYDYTDNLEGLQHGTISDEILPDLFLKCLDDNRLDLRSTSVCGLKKVGRESGIIGFVFGSTLHID